MSREFTDTLYNTTRRNCLAALFELVNPVVITMVHKICGVEFTKQISRCINYSKYNGINIYLNCIKLKVSRSKPLRHFGISSRCPLTGGGFTWLLWSTWTCCVFFDWSCLVFLDFFNIFPPENKDSIKVFGNETVINYYSCLWVTWKNKKWTTTWK